MSTSVDGDAVPRRPGWWRPAAWIVVVGLSLLPPGPSWIVAGCALVAGASVLIAEYQVLSIPIRIGLVALTAACGITATLLVPTNGLGPVPIFIAAVSAARIVPWRRTVLGIGLVLGLLFSLTVAYVSGTPWALFAGLGVPMIAARSWDREALRREHQRVLALLAELEGRRESDLRAAAADERTRIARDLHDVLAHSLSGLSLHLQAARAVVARQPDADGTVVTSLDRAADLARDGLAEARRAVAALRDAPAPDAADLTALVEGHAGARLVVHGSFDALAPVLRETAFATVRESLTNAGRYAPGSAVSVEVDTVDGLAVRVDDDGATTTVAPASAGGGHGLQGLAERAAAIGGSLLADARERGWSVVLRVPAT